MIDPMVSLAFAVYSNKGVYALLLGSGISRASGIPTGWEVVLDLVRKVAELEGEDCGPDPVDWFGKKHGVEPDYSKLLDKVANMPAERQQLLRGYFEPSDEERDQGLKLPSAAHKAIAQLVAAGYLRVIITTNFDRLMEKALEEVGVNPTVISTTDQLLGALPLAHSGATVIKLHGDYLDTRIKNTERELAKYDDALDGLLDRLFDEYGLIVSGWSGDWDIALRAALERCPNRRFTTFWTTKSPLSEKGKKLAKHRQAVVLQIKDANQLFESLREKVQALGDMAAPHPLSAKMAAATVKRHLVDPSAKIRLRDFVHDETEKLYAGINGPAFGVQNVQISVGEIRKRIENYVALSEILTSVLIAGSYWGDADATKLWVAALQRIVNPSNCFEGSVALIKLSRYPSLLLFYSAGLAAVASGNHKALADVMLKPKVKISNYEDRPIATKVYPTAVFDPEISKFFKNNSEFARHPAPFSYDISTKLRGPLREYLPRDEDYVEIFDRFEYLLGLVNADFKCQDHDFGGWWGPVGCFAWRDIHGHQKRSISQKLDAEIEAEGADWPPLGAGFFGGSLERVRLAKGNFDAFLSRVHTQF